MMDIVEGLRKKINPLYVNIPGTESNLYKEYADEIERLRNELAALRQKIASLEPVE